MSSLSIEIEADAGFAKPAGADRHRTALSGFARRLSGRRARFAFPALPATENAMATALQCGTGLRIALFTGNYNYVRDGSNQALNRLVGYLERQGAVVRVYAPTVDNPAFEPVGTLVSVPSVAIPRRNEYRLALGMPQQVKDDLDAFAPNLVHLSTPDLLGVAALKHARRMGLPVVASVHTRFETYLRYYGLGWLEPALRRHLRGFYNRCDQIFVPTACMIGSLRKGGITRDIRQWGRGVDLDLFSPRRRDGALRQSLGFAEQDVVVAFVGRVVKEKGLTFFADCIARLEAAGVRHRVLVVGDGPERAAFAARLPRAVFTGFLEGECLARAYASADIFFNPSTTETFGNVTLEAMASGLGVICARATGSQSLIQHGQDGFLYDADDRAQCVDALATLIGDTALRTRLGAAAAERARTFDWDTILDGVLQNYWDVLRQELPAGPAQRVGHRSSGILADAVIQPGPLAAGPCPAMQEVHDSSL